MKKTLIALAVAASAVVSGSAMAAWSTGGDFNGNINIGGNITTDAPAWLWKTGADQGTAVDLKLADAVVSGDNNVWSGVGAKWHLNRSQFGIRIDHDLASISDHSLASQSITIWHASDH